MSRAAVDLGAGSGRVMLGTQSRDTLKVREIHRFQYSPRVLDGHLRWDMAALFDGLDRGLAAAQAAAKSANVEAAIAEKRLILEEQDRERTREQERKLIFKRSEKNHL